ncbi:MAG: methyltransferase family protein, partial [Coriobacteriia bacterium]
KNYYRQDRRVVRSARSLVETGSMAAFFVLYYLVIKFRLLELSLPTSVRVVMVAAGLIVVIAGAVFNIWGRLVLKASWANQILIFEDHALVTSGPFSVVRHPLYASLLWMFVGGSLIYSNVLSLVLTLGAFVPMMVVRARAEDALLRETFAGPFEEYRNRTGMFFPRVWR